MGLFKNILKKKPGGTMFGNMLRGAASQFTGGILGTGSDRIEMGNTQTNQEIAMQQMQSEGLPMQRPTAASQFMDTVYSGIGAGVGLKLAAPAEAGAKSAVTEWLKKYWYLPVLVIGGIIGLIIYKRK